MKVRWFTLSKGQPEDSSRERAELLARRLLRRLDGTQIGHCLRVDYLDLDEAAEVARALIAVAPPDLELGVGVLAGAQPRDPARYGDLLITADRAIERRNRKAERLCLFVPSHIVDAAASSLANSFAPVDGRDLHAEALEGLLRELPHEVRGRVDGVLGKLYGHARCSNEDRLDFVLAACQHWSSGTIDQLGRELWRVGLIVDAGADFHERLASNRRSALLLARPARAHATIRARVSSLGVDARTGQALLVFFADRSAHDVRAWSRAILDEAPSLTFDRWVFPEEEHSDIRAVTLKPFVDAQGRVEKYCKLQQPDGPGGALVAPVGPEASITVRWQTDPPRPANLQRWRVEIVPASGRLDELEIDLPSREVAGARREISLKLDLEIDPEDPPRDTFQVRVVALDAAGNEMQVTEATASEGSKVGDPIAAVSEEFYLARDTVDRLDRPSDRIRGIPTLAFGRLEVASESKTSAVEESQPLWSKGVPPTFTVRVGERKLLRLVLNPLLLDLERRTLDAPQQGGRYTLTVEDLAPVTADSVQSLPLAAGSGEPWAGFWRARGNFFQRVRGDAVRNVLEVADWTPDLAGAAIRYAQAYRELLDGLAAAGDPVALREALSLDTLLVTIRAGATPEQSLVVLPTHPLRAAWYAGYSQLLAAWEHRLLEMEPKQRRRALDLGAVRELVPINVPPFAWHPSLSGPFVFFQNLQFFHGVALPPDAADPQRRFADLALVLGADESAIVTADLRPERLAEHLRHFRALHPYVHHVAVTLLNPDRGDYLAEALRSFQEPAGEEDEEGAPARPATSFAITAYVDDEQVLTLKGLDALRHAHADERPASAGDPFQPLLSVTVCGLSKLEDEPPRDAHVAIVSDLTRPSVVVAEPADTAREAACSFALHGLIARFVSRFEAGAEGVRWLHSLATEAGAIRVEPHPAVPRYSDTLVELHTALLRAVGRAIRPDVAEARPGLEVRLDHDSRRRLEQLHARSDWVVTIDRFFGLDYFDSPNEPHLGNVARKYLLDYAPELAEGLGHRLVVTTAWREEVRALLQRAMVELGFEGGHHSVERLLHFLKTVSGRLALDALGTPNQAVLAVAVGVATAWLDSRRRLSQAVLVPVALHPRLFMAPASRADGAEPNERSCDLVLFGLRRNIVEATLIAVRIRRGQVPLESLAEDMSLQMHSTREIIRGRFFDPDRVDGALQRAHLATVLRFYLERARRYGIFDEAAVPGFLEHVGRLEKAGLDFRASCEGYVVSLEDERQHPFVVDDQTRVYLLTARDLEASTEFASPRDRSARGQDGQHRPVSRDGASAEGGPAATGSPRDRADDGSEGVTKAGRAQPQGSGAEVEGISGMAGGNPSPVPGVDDIVVPLGRADGREVEWRPSTRGSPHLFIVGIPGQGKSWTVLRLLAALGQHAVPPLVLDFHGQFAAEQWRFSPGLRPVALDASQGMPFSPFELPAVATDEDVKASAYAIAEIFAHVCALGDMQRDIIYTAVRDAYRSAGYGQPDDGVERRLPTMDDIRRRIERSERERNVSNVLARCRPLLELSLFKPPAGAHPDMMDLVRAGLIVDLHRLAVEAVQVGVGAFLLRKLYRDMFRWGETDRIRLVVVLDEAHRLARDVTLPKIMKEGRKFGLAVVVASQGLGDFHQDVLGNAGTRVIFRTNYPESRRLAGFLRGRGSADLAAQLEQLPVGRAYVQTPAMQYALPVQMYPLDR